MLGKFRRPPMKVIGPILDCATGRMYQVYPLTRRQYKRYRARERRIEQGLRKILRPLFRSRRACDQLVDSHMRMLYASRSIPVEIISERSRKKINFVDL